jgi:hypothetical protein
MGGDTVLTQQLRTTMPLGATLGMDVVAAAPDEVHLRLEWSEGSARLPVSSTAAC